MLGSSCGVDASAGPRAQPSSFREALATGDASLASQWVRYPLRRPFPLPPVADAEDFVRRFDELFPAALLGDVAASKDEDWQRVGWRGVMFGNGRLWIDDEMRLFGHNEESAREREHREGIIARDRALLDETLRGHAEPVLRWLTADYRVRVDRMPDDSLRYTSWRRDAPLGAKPDLELHRGERVFEGSGGNEHYLWRNGAHTYRCEITVLGSAESVPLELVVLRGDEVLLEQAAEVSYP